MMNSLIKKIIVNPEDFKESYNNVVETYNLWNKHIGKNSEIMINEILPENNDEILDFACGNGFITENLLKLNQNIKISAVDISENMINFARSNNLNDFVSFIVCDGIEYLKNCTKKFDKIYFGWGMSYFNIKILFPLLKKVLKPNGLIYIITNTQTTFNFIQPIILNITIKNIVHLRKLLFIKNNLPKNMYDFKNILKIYGLNSVYLSENEKILTWNCAKDAYYWLKESGIISGVKFMFDEKFDIDKAFINYIEKHCKISTNEYFTKHGFTTGIFKEGF